MGKKKHKNKHKNKSKNKLTQNLQKSINKPEIDKYDESLNDSETVSSEVITDIKVSSVQDDNAKKKRKKKDKFAFTKDIKYRGPLSYRHLKILGWICIILSQVVIIESLKQKALKTEPSFFQTSVIITYITDLALPLLLISVFAFLLLKRSNYMNTIIVNGLLAAGLIALFMVVYNRYILGIVGALFKTDRTGAASSLNGLIFDIDTLKGFFAFNIFIDIFICSLIMFFLDYNPKRFFQGKKRLIFRSLVILPLAYEVVCVFIKIAAINHFISIPFWISPFLTTKPPVSILMFLSIVRYIKIQEKKYLATGRTIEQYHEYQKTNIHSFRFSRHLILIILVYSILDMLLLIILTSAHIVLINGITTLSASEENIPIIIEALFKVNSWGIGDTTPMILLIPIILLFSYTRKHKDPIIDTLIPVAAVIIIVICYIDGIYQIIQGVIGNFLPEMDINLDALEELFNVFGQMQMN